MGLKMKLRRLHRWNAIFLTSFLILHLANHMALLGGTNAHLAFHQLIVPIYRALPIETLLLTLFAVQIGLGFRLSWRKRKIRGFWSKLQLASGLYLAFFLSIHIGAVLIARAQQVETNIHFAAAGLHVPWLWMFFIPYYFLAVSALFAHAATFLHRRHEILAIAVLCTGLIVAVIFVIGMLGHFGGDLPPDLYLDRLRLSD